MCPITYGNNVCMYNPSCEAEYKVRTIPWRFSESSLDWSRHRHSRRRSLSL